MSKFKFALGSLAPFAQTLGSPLALCPAREVLGASAIDSSAGVVELWLGEPGPPPSPTKTQIRQAASSLYVYVLEWERDRCWAGDWYSLASRSVICGVLS